MLDLNYLRTFTAVVETGNFNLTAVKLGCSQSTVTFHIKAVEREFGVLLLERHKFGKSIALTEFGRQAYAYAQRLLSLAEEAEQSVRKAQVK
jgi:DNA-binding transcriptional LysR family regulator